ncbi:TPA: Mov34/MPN/PAD-1 family protein [Photobacterium damselae]|uniref:Mov34/MPN/PAD-1 family protein n=1 Tax=Photobacterium damselae TaxID=38293 RepID=UPI001EDFD610|nr:Mov34/MPN/PAD-1 family protein [Photobacterium damselae]MCG3816355.1 Mov34/MPN/PAD-1 family protein [Photobacterium damselae]
MQLVLPNNVLKKLRFHMFKAGKREIGGMLMGEDLGEQVFRIIDFSVDMKRGTTSSFLRDSDEHDLALLRFYEETGANYKRFNYLGEWHSHPSFSVAPSINDISAMQGIVNGGENVDFAFLFISRLRWFGLFECSANLFVRGHQPIQVEIIIEKNKDILFNM